MAFTLKHALYIDDLFNFILNIGDNALWRVCANQFCAQVHQKNRINKITQLVVVREASPNRLHSLIDFIYQ